MTSRWAGRGTGLLAAVALGLAAPGALPGQTSSESIIRGILKITQSGTPLEGARVTLSMRRLDGRSTEADAQFRTTTDARGEFEFPALVPGRYVIRAAAIGYLVVVSPIDLQHRQTVDLELVTEAQGVTLPELTVEERANHGPVDWIRRRSEGRGRYLGREEIERRQARTLPDAMRMVPGVRVECRTSSVCAIRLVRAPRGCNPAFFMDGIPSDPAIAYLTPIQDVEGVEVYAGPSETPPELESPRARCGVVVVWTRTPPPRRPRPPKPTAVPDTLAPPADRR